MTKVGTTWHWLVEKIKGSRSSLKDGPPYRSLPPIPEPKVRDKARYTIVIIGESGASHQLELTGFRLRVIAASFASVAVLVVVLVIGWGSLFSGNANRGVKDLGGANTAQTESGKAKKSQPNQISREIRPQESSPQVASESVVAQRPTEMPGAKGGATDSATETVETVSSGAMELSKTAKGALPLSAGGEEKTKSQRVAAGSEPGSKTPPKLETPASAPGERPEPAGVVSRTPAVNFNAQEVVASADTPNGGTLSFRLVKDQPETRFEGYLFVYVEMEDASGENKIYVYPKQTRLGDGDLPFDYKDGENIAFKYNSRVELPYGDSRSGATLAGVSILLYGEQGKIVFQRSFGRQELSVVNTKNSKAEKSKSRTGEKRQAL